MPGLATICVLFSHKANGEKAHKYRLCRHLPSYIGLGLKIVSRFYEKQNAIEQELGVTLDWRELPEKKASRIMLTRQVDFDNRSAWNAQFDWMMEMSLKFKKVFKKYL